VPGAGALTAAPHDATATTAWRGAATTGPQNPQEINRYSYALNNPMRYNDPSGQCVGPVIVYCVGVGAKALFDAATAGELAGATGAETALTTAPATLNIATAVTRKQGVILEAKKEDVKFIDRLVKKYGLTKDQRRELHDEITKQGYSPEEIEEIAKDIADRDDNDY
jgi:hypothetical protein